MTDISNFPDHTYSEKDLGRLENLYDFYQSTKSDYALGIVLAKALWKRYSQPECGIEYKLPKLFATNKERTYVMSLPNVIRYEGLHFYHQVLEDFILEEYQRFLEAMKERIHPGPLLDSALESLSRSRDKALKSIKAKSRQQPIWNQARVRLKYLI